ncbi:MAG: hypothetical protein WC303_03760 [Candidatus Paceibacterota bacterium]
MVTKISNLIKRGYITLTNSDESSVAYCQVSYLDEKIETIESIYPYGLSANAPLNNIVLLFNVNGSESNLAGIPYSQSNRFKNLKPGEVAIGSPMSGSYIKFNESKDITVYTSENFISNSKSYSLTTTDYSVTSTYYSISNGNITAASLTANNLSANKTVLTDGNKKLISSATTSTELGYLSGVTSDIQTQLNGKEPTLAKGNLTATDNLLVTNGTNAVIGSGTSVGLAAGYLIPTTTEKTNWNNAYAAAITNATSLNTISTIVKRDSNGRTAVSLNDDAVSPILSVDHNNRNLCSTTGVKTLGWGGSNLEIYADSGVANFSFERLTGRLSLIGVILNGEATLSKYNTEKPNVAFSGIWAASQTKQLTIQILGSVVTILFPDCLATATTASYISATLPGGYYPSSSTLYEFIPRTVDNGTSSSAPSLITIDTDGVLKIYNGVGNFTGSGSSGFKSFCLTFNIS